VLVQVNDRDIRRFGDLSGSHLVGHTRMATESGAMYCAES